MTRSRSAAIVAAVATLCAGFVACSKASSSSPPASSDAGAEAGPAETGPGGAGPTETGPLDAGVGLTCALLLSCDEPCSTNACTNGCYAEATAHAQGLFNNF